MWGLKAFFLAAIATAMASTGKWDANWGVIMTYYLSAIVFFLVGVIFDMNRPQLVEVLLRHDGQGYLLKVARTRGGELFAPGDESLRKLKKVAVKDLPHTILGCPRFTVQGTEENPQFMVLGQIYA